MIVQQILLISILRNVNVKRTVWKTSILRLGCNGLNFSNLAGFLPILGRLKQNLLSSTTTTPRSRTADTT